MAAQFTDYERRIYNKGRAAGSKEERGKLRTRDKEISANIPLRKRWDPKLIESNPARVFKEWAETYLVVPEGPLRGQPFKIPKWQENFIRGVMRPEIQEAGLSISRKNGKTNLLGAWALAYLAGPFCCGNPEFRMTVCSLDASLAKEFRRAVQKIAEASGYSEEIRIYQTPTPGRIEGRFGNTLDILAAGESSGHARGSDVVFLDEAGLLPEKMRDLWNALYSSISGRDGKFICLSIRGDSPMFSEMRERKDDPSVFWTEYSADEKAELTSRKAWSDANPGLKGGIKSARYMERASVRAKRTPGDESKFRAFDLNQPQSPDRNLIVSPSDWEACTTTNLPERSGGCYLGFDAGVAASMTAGAAYWPATGRLECLAALPATPTLAARGQADGVGARYELMEKRGELKTFPGLVTPLKEFISYWMEILEGIRIVGFAADRFKKAETQQALQEAGIRVSIEWRSMVWKEASEDVRHFQRAVISQKVKTLPSLLMASAIADSALERDNLSNERLDRSHARGKIDSLASAVLAVGAGERHTKMTSNNKTRGVLLGVA